MRFRGMTAALAAGVVAAGAGTAGATITIDIRTSEGAVNFDPTGFFTTNPGAMTALEAAASFFESLFEDDLEAITPDFGDDPGDFTFNEETMMFEPNNPAGNIWAATFINPGTGVGERISGLNVEADTLIIYAGARDLSGTTLGVGGPGGREAIGSNAFLDTVFTRGEVGAPTSEFGPWGGAIAFDTMNGANERVWNFDVENGPSGGENDFLSVALHELGHLLGLGTAASWNALIAEGFFTGENVVAEAGGNVALHGDLAHFAENTMSDVFPGGDEQEAAMDPNIQVGTRKVFTDLDVAALVDVGWEISLEGTGGEAIPEPTTMALLTLLGVGAAVRRRRTA